MSFETEKQKARICRWSKLAWRISKLTDVDRHELEQHWRTFSKAYEPQQFHVGRNGLALLVAYVVHLIDIVHVTVPQ